MIVNEYNQTDPSLLWAEIIQLRQYAQGPEGYSTWQAAAVAERVRRVKAESILENPLTNAARDVLAERLRQTTVEEWTIENDDYQNKGELALAASIYAHPAPLSILGSGIPLQWPWEDYWYKPKDRRGNCVKAAALLLAEIERLDRIKEND